MAGKRPFILVLWLLILTFAASAAGEDAYDIDSLAAGVVRLEVYDADGGYLGTGSGFALGDPAVLVTAAHVLVNMDHMIAYRDDGTSFRVDRALDGDTDSDIAVCLLPEDADLPPLTAATETARRGDDVTVIASQFGLTNLISKGTLCGRWITRDADWLLFTAPVSAGSSGGPVFDAAGAVIGIVTGTYEKGQNLNLAAPIEAALELID